MAANVRVSMTVRLEIANRFNALYKGRDRGRAVERLLSRAIAEREFDAVAAAHSVETEADFANIRELAEDVDALSVETAGLKSL